MIRTATARAAWLRQAFWRIPTSATLLLVALAACDAQGTAPPGGLEDTATAPADTGAGDTTPAPSVRPAHCSAQITPGPAPLRRLTKTEYNNTVAELLGDTSRPADAFPPEEETLGFDNNASGRGVTQVHIERYMQAAEQLVKAALDNHRALVIPCDPDDIGAVLCAEQTVKRFGRLVYRRPLATTEVEVYRQYFEALYATEGFDGAIAMLLEVLLQSPHFLYRTELGGVDDDGDGVVALTGYELATRMSYLFWGSMPDDALLAAAEIGLLDTPQGIASEARRMLADPKARGAIQHFHDQWLQLKMLPDTYKDHDLFPEFTEGLKDKLLIETRRFIDHVIFDGEGDLGTLLSATYSFVDPELAAHYGLEAPVAPPVDARTGFVRTELDPEERAGLFTHASILSVQAKYNQTSPVLRGKFVREQILCQHLNPPPANINITPPDLDPGLTTRERFSQHSDSEECAPCHKKMDPVGLAFENYDSLGRWRDEENGLPIDTTGELRFTWDVDGDVDNALDIAHRLAGSEEVRQCYVTQWFRYTHGRDVAYDDECHVWDLMRAFEAADWDIQEMLVALTQTEAFRYRRVIVPGSGDVPGAGE
ncbi:MAG: DUF1592 domain-containing protein [Deltaproteobacteria bacterium]|nr:DUF1592 domain-containing protein [Deltaproteobacteria bacterium]